MYTVVHRCTFMYTDVHMDYTVAELRKHIKEALDAIERGKVVSVTRYGRKFNIGIVGDSTTPRKIDEFADATEVATLACCRGAKPCKHWVWDSVEQVYKNTLTSNIRGGDE